MKTRTLFHPIVWKDVAPSDHILQIYENDEEFISSLTNFAGTGINANDGVVIIATQQHLDALSDKLMKHGIHVNDLVEWGRYIPIEVNDALSQFMVGGKPDEVLFNQFISETMEHARKNSSRVRVFGEMVAILWARGQHEGTVKLERMWNHYLESDEFTLFCAYPQHNLVDDDKSIKHICGEHSKVMGKLAIHDFQRKVA